MRYFLKVAYVGTGYAGSQIQKNALSVQEVLENALEKILRTPTPLTGASRTDAGVHALENYYHFDTPSLLDAPKIIYALNAVLPKDISVGCLVPVGETAHARFDAKTRSYIYIIEPQKNPFTFLRAYLIKHPLDLSEAKALERIILQHQEFSSFSKKHTDNSTCTCTITQCHWEQTSHQIHFHITANRFLRGMVRALVATQLDVFTGKLTTEQFEDYFRFPKLAQANFSAPAHGLYLAHIDYPDALFFRPS